MNCRNLITVFLNSMKEEITEALSWITRLLDAGGVPRQFVGGLAARAYGGTRELNDIDLYVPDSDLDRIAEAGAAHLVREPRHHFDKHWDLIFLQFLFAGRQIEIAGADSARVWDSVSGRWRPADVDFSRSVVCRVEGFCVPIMPLSQLMDYKRGLARPVDLVDLAEIAEAQASQ
ncbi:MAG: hypothetical protein HKO65_09580 [Gemmatimonadetes bacterium]|nr:nucleotidyltransferase family protein [Gemmatimonadota bacterium]NNM05342.1 hypothetical protein [Gemmatimonadota bacterium]